MSVENVGMGAECFSVFAVFSQIDIFTYLLAYLRNRVSNKMAAICLAAKSGGGGGYMHTNMYFYLYVIICFNLV